MIPIVLAVLISYALAPVVTWLEQRRIPRLAGAGLVLLLLLCLCASGIYALRDDARELIEKAPAALQRGRELVVSQLGSAGKAIEQQPDGGAVTNSVVQQLVRAAFGFAGHVVVIFFLMYFLLISGDHVKKRLVEIAGSDSERRRTTLAIIDDINKQIQRYLLVLLITAVIVGASTWLVLAWIGVQHAAMWGILAGLFNSIPYLGPVIVSGGLFVVGVVQGGGIMQALQMSGTTIVITSLEGWLITPPLMGKAERMSALAVFIGMLLWTWVWGAWGTLLAVPMLVVIKSIADHVDALKPLGRLMAP